MLKKFFLLGFLVFLAIVIAGGWFGFQAYVHASRSAAIQTRQASVVAQWLMNPEAVKQAATGKGGITVAGIDANWQHEGVTVADAYRQTKSGLQIRYGNASCEGWRYTYDVKRVNGVLSVIVYVDQPWLPDFGAIWNQIRGAACAAMVTMKWMPVTLDTPLGTDAMINGSNGRSMLRIT